MKTTIGSSGYFQVIDGITRTWPGVRETQIDHCWVNSPEKVIQTMNFENEASDHNIIGIQIRLVGILKNCQNFKKRKWGNFSQESYNQRISEIDWDEMYKLTDVNLAWDYLESNLIEIPKN